MNIVTYCNAVSVASPKQWIISLYKGTLTKLAFLDTKIGVLQLLGRDQHDIVPILGKRSGLERGFSKKATCDELGCAWVKFHASSDSLLNDFDGMSLLPECSSYIFLRMNEDTTMNAGDHEVFLCSILGTGFWDASVGQVVVRGIDQSLEEPRDQESVLYTGKLRSMGII